MLKSTNHSWKANYNENEILLYILPEHLKLKRLTSPSVVEDIEQLKLSFTDGGDGK